MTQEKKASPRPSKVRVIEMNEEDIPPWEKSSDKPDLEEETATTQTTLGGNGGSVPTVEENIFDDTVITKPTDRVHADLFGGGEALFGQGSRFEALKNPLKLYLEASVAVKRGLLALVIFILGITVFVLTRGHHTRQINMEQIAVHTEPPSVESSVEKPAAVNAAAPSGQGARITIVSEPAGAKVFIDGIDQGSQTPFTIQGISAGVNHFLVLQLEGYESFQSKITLAAGEKKELRFNLQARRIKLTLRSEPTGAKVTINGKLVGTTPTEGSLSTFLDSAEKKVRVDITRDGYEPYTTVLAVGNEDLDIAPALVAMQKTASNKASIPKAKTANGHGVGYLTLKAAPWAIVYIDNKRVGRRTPIQKLKWPSGRHKVQFVNPQNGKERTIMVDLTPNHERSLEVDLK